MRRYRWSRPLWIMATLLCAATAIADDAKRGALFVVGQSASVAQGEDLESAIVIGGSLDVQGKVRGLAAAVGGDLSVGPKAFVGGPAASIGGQLAIDGAARVSGPKVHVAGGDFSQVADELSATQSSHPPPAWTGSALRAMQVLSAFVLGLFLVLWAPEAVRTVRNEVQSATGRDLLLGLALFFGVVPVCLLLAVSIVGIALIPAVLLFVLISFAFGLVSVGAQIGRRLSVGKNDEHLLTSVAVGMLALAAGAALPFLGAFILFAACVYGAGAVLATRFGTRPRDQRPPMKQSAPPAAVGSPLSDTP